MVLHPRLWHLPLILALGIIPHFPRDSTALGRIFYPYSRGPVTETEEILPHRVLNTTTPESPSLIP